VDIPSLDVVVSRLLHNSQVINGCNKAQDETLSSKYFTERQRRSSTTLFFFEFSHWLGHTENLRSLYHNPLPLLILSPDINETAVKLILQENLMRHFMSNKLPLCLQR